MGEAVPDAPDVDNGLGAVGVELAAQPAGMRVEGAGARGRLEAPDLAQEFVLGEHSLGVFCECGQEGELEGAELDRRAGDADLARGGVDLDRADALDPRRTLRDELQHGAQMQIARAGGHVMVAAVLVGAQRVELAVGDQRGQRDRGEIRMGAGMAR
jgi:hypothetical protein